MFSAETLGRAQPESLGLYGVFSGRVPVSTYWGFPGPGPQYKSRQNRLGISFLSCWVGPVDSPHLSVQKAWTLFGLYCMKCWGSEQSFWTRVPLQYVARRLSNEGQASTLTCVQVQQTSWSSWCLQIQTNRVFSRGVSWISPKSGILIQEAGDESCYDLRADLTPCLNGTEIYSIYPVRRLYAALLRFPLVYRGLLCGVDVCWSSLDTHWPFTWLLVSCSSPNLSLLALDLSRTFWWICHLVSVCSMATFSYEDWVLCLVLFLILSSMPLSGI